MSKQNLLSTDQSKQQFWDVFLIKRTVVNTQFFQCEQKVEMR